MPTGNTTLLGLALPVQGELDGTWGDVVNQQITELLDTAVAGTTTLNTDADVTLTTTVLAANQARQAVLLWTANGTTTRNITAPAQSKAYIVINASAGTQSIVIRGAGPTTGVTLIKGEKALVAWNGTDFVKVASSEGDGTFTTVDTTNLEVTNIKAKDGTTAATIANTTGIITVSSELNVDNLNLSTNTISSTNANGNIVLAPNGTGDVQVDADTLRIGDANANATLTTNGTGNLTLSTNSGTNSGTVVINQGVNGNIELAPNGTGDVYLTADLTRLGDSNADATLTTNGTGDLILNTNSGTNSGSITIQDGVNGNILLAPNGTGLSVARLTTAATNTVTPVMRLDSQSSGTPAVGIGVGLQFAAETAAGNTEVGATLEAITTDVTAASEDFDLSVKLMIAGAAAAEVARFKSTGLTLATGDTYQINNTDVLSATTLGSGVTSSSLTSVGTIGTGTWQGTVIDSTYGGTGVNNGGRTLTLNTNSGTLAFGAASKTLTVNNSLTLAGTDATTMTFPTTSATIARTDAAQTFTGTQTVQAAATQDAVAIAGRAGGTGSFAATLTTATLAASVTHTLPAITGTLATLANTAQTFAGTTTFSGATVTVGTSTAASTYGVGTGATISGSTKTLNLGTAGVSGSTTAVNIGSAVSGATNNITINGNPTFSAGTANGVAYLNGSKVLTTGSALVFDGTKLGIGSAPATTSGRSVDLDGVSLQPLFTMRASSLTSATATWTLDNTNSLITFDGSASWPFRWVLAGSEQMRLTSTGLGIGTSSPGFKLQVIGTSQLSLSAAGTQQALQLNNSDTTAGTQAVKLGFSSAGVTKASINAAVYGNDYMTFNVGSDTERMRLDSSGNLGLGVTPSAWRSGARALQLGVTGYVSAFEQSNGSANFAFNAFESGTNAFSYTASTFASRYAQVSGQHQWYNAPSGTAGNAISFTQAMTLDASGRLAIGTTSPIAFSNQTSVTVNGTNNGRFDIKVGDTHTAAFVGGSSAVEFSAITNVPMTFATNSTERARITSGGDLLVGLTSGGKFSVSYGGNDTHFGLGANYDNYITAGSSGVTIFRNTSTERARITSDGDFLVGTTTTGFTNSRSFTFQGVGDGKVYVNHSTANVNGDGYIGFGYNGTQIGSITQNGTTAVAYNTSSDYRLKHDIAPMTGALAKVALLKPCTYKWNADDSAGEGFIAHELAEVCPQAVTGEKDAVDADGNPKYQGIDTSFLVATLTAAIQELKAEFDAYKATHP